MNHHSQEYESCEIPFLYPAIYVSFQHICTGSPQADCFLHLGQYPHILFILQNSGRRWSRTIRTTMATDLQSVPATSTEYSPITRKNRVSNRFIVLCFPLSTSFSAVDSLDIFMRLWAASLENSFY